jgi:hypothetical protein
MNGATFNVSVQLEGSESLNPDWRVYLGLPTEAVKLFREAVNGGHESGHEHGHVSLWRHPEIGPPALDSELRW